MSSDKLTSILGVLIAIDTALGTFGVIPVEVAGTIGAVLTTVFGYFTNKGK